MGADMKHKRKLRALQKRKIGCLIKIAKEKLAYDEAVLTIEETVNAACDRYFAGGYYEALVDELAVLERKYPKNMIDAEIARNAKASTLWISTSVSRTERRNSVYGLLDRISVHSGEK